MRGYRISIGLSTVITLGMLIALACYFPSLTEKIPIHYGLSGIADAWGSKSTLLWFVGIQVVMFLVFAILSRYPQIHNYPVKVTEENREELFKLSQTCLAHLSLCLSLIFGYVFVMMLIGSNSLLLPMVLIFFLVLLLLPIYYIYKMLKLDTKAGRRS